MTARLASTAHAPERRSVDLVPDAELDAAAAALGWPDNEHGRALALAALTAAARVREALPVSEWRYTDPTALVRMRDGLCPECGELPSWHSGWGGPVGCTLTDNGAAARIAQSQAGETKTR